MEQVIHAGGMKTSALAAAGGLRRVPKHLFDHLTLLSVLAGMLTLLLWPRLQLSLLLALSACGLLCLCSASSRRIGIASLAAAWAAAAAYMHITAIDDEHWQQPLQVQAAIVGIPRHEPDLSRLSLLLQQPEDLHGMHISANWFRPQLPTEQLPSSGELWTFELQLRPPYGRVNRHGFDYARWLIGSGVHATASIQSGYRAVSGERPAIADWSVGVSVVRAETAAWVSRTLPLQQAGLARALLVGDRSQLNDTTRDLLAATGTSHLLAISGLHIGLVALLGALFLRALSAFMLLLPVPGLQHRLQGLQLQHLALASGLLLAVMYAVLSGFLVSTQRAMIMLLVAALALLSRRQQLSGRSLLLAAVLIVASNPLQVLNAGFWLSFVAVFSLWLVFAHRSSNGGRLKTLLLAQLALTCTMLMVQLALMQQFSLLMLPVNLLAIPVVSVVIMPCLLLSLCLHLLGLGLADPCLQAGGQMLQWLQQLLSLADSHAPLSSGWLHTAQVDLFGLFLLGIVGGFWLVLPRGIPLRWLALCLWLPVLWPVRPQLPFGAWHAEVLDVGQGTAVVVRTAGHVLMYDSGPGDNLGRDRIADSLPPLLQQWQLDVDRVVVSHGDMDHAGGLFTLREAWPQAEVISSDSRLGDACTSGQHWRWDGVDFTILHPGRHLPYMKNNSSCVVLVSSLAGSMLLSGDIDDTIERRLLHQWQGPPADVLLVPHHGSSYSSSSEWLQDVAPHTAVVTAGQWNRFQFPKSDVIARYQQQGIRLYGTAGCGAISIRAGAAGDGIRSSSRRLQRPRWWQNTLELDCRLTSQ
jgi:competence protein ComEC